MLSGKLTLIAYDDDIEYFLLGCQNDGPKALCVIRPNGHHTCEPLEGSTYSGQDSLEGSTSTDQCESEAVAGTPLEAYPILFQTMGCSVDNVATMYHDC
ncbi:hypothetical protein NHX12_014827 [Muraenolepis orangiensis]|uniref:Uncharacterized protein n=1 Tax=Muraenolepis orangiensis TaxID=630683 RepID=A0A9Q0D9J4_9TELE|nr:hypothetical protein NHX12_014827 [Muraenolepis orangiensis]